jgi:predicted amidohydrolase
MESRRVKVAADQTDPKIADKEKNLQEILSCLQNAAKEEANLVVFPECALTGYSFSSLEEVVPRC